MHLENSEAQSIINQALQRVVALHDKTREPISFIWLGVKYTLQGREFVIERKEEK